MRESHIPSSYFLAQLLLIFTFMACMFFYVDCGAVKNEQQISDLKSLWSLVHSILFTTFSIIKLIVYVGLLM
jgi:hypothetical protein